MSGFAGAGYGEERVEQHNIHSKEIYVIIFNFIREIEKEYEHIIYC